VRLLEAAPKGYLSDSSELVGINYPDDIFGQEMPSFPASTILAIGINP
jgi:hypothetical protein